MADTATRERTWTQTVVGTIFVVVGVTVLVERVTGRDLTVLPLAIGVLLLISYRRTQSHRSLVWGSIVTGAGMGWFLSSATGHVLGGAIFCLCMAMGLGLLFSVDGRRSAWASVAALVFLFFAALALLFDLGDALSDDTGNVLFPAVLVGAGVLLLARNALPRRAVLVGLALLLALAIGASSDRVDFGRPGVADTRALELPDLDGRPLVVATVSGDITVHEGSLSAEVTTARRRDTVAVRSLDGAVRLVGGASASFELFVPRGSNLQLSTTSGDVEVEVAGEPEVDVRTVSGDIDAEDIDNVAEDGTRRFTAEGDEGEITVTTVSGDVTLIAA